MARYEQEEGINGSERCSMDQVRRDNPLMCSEEGCKPSKRSKRILPYAMPNPFLTKQDFDTALADAEAKGLSVSEHLSQLTNSRQSP